MFLIHYLRLLNTLSTPVCFLSFILALPQVQFRQTCYGCLVDRQQSGETTLLSLEMILASGSLAPNFPMTGATDAQLEEGRYEKLDGARSRSRPVVKW